MALISLLLLGLIATACGSDDSTTSDPDRAFPIPSPGSTPQLTAQQIFDNAVEVFDDVVSYRAEGGYLSYEPDSIDEPESASVTFEWAAPDRSRQVTRHERLGTIVETQNLFIGDRVFTLSGLTPGEPWREARTRRFTDQAGSEIGPAEDNRLIFLDGVIPDEPAEVIDFNGTVAYRISGVHLQPDFTQPEEGEQELETRVVLVVDAETFLVLRDERVMRFENPVQEFSLDMSGPVELVEEGVLEFSIDFVYFDEPLVIEVPQDYVPYNGGTDPRLLPTPTAVVRIDGLPTPTPPVVIPAPPTLVPRPIATFAPDDPNQHIPFYLYETPWYDKLELDNDVVVGFSQCGWRYSILDRAFNITINYMPDGSKAGQSWLGGSEFFAENADGFTYQRFQSDEGRAAVEAVLNDPELMKRILDYSDFENRCPAEFLGYTGDSFAHLPETDRYRIDDQTIARFEACSTTGVTLAGPVLIAHTPSQTVVALSSVDRFPQTVWHEPDGDEDHLWKLVRDKSLLAKLIEMAPRSARCN